MNIDGSGLQRFTTHPGQDLEPAWSPGGDRLCWTSNSDGSIRLYCKNLDGSNQINLTPNIQHAQQSSWSPNGDKIAFRFADSNRAGIGLKNPDGTGFTKLVDEPFSGRIPGGPKWSPDGRWIAFYAHTHGNWELYRKKADGTGEIERLTNNLAIDQQPVWSRDGSKIYFTSDRATPGTPGELDLYSIDVNTKVVTQITNYPGRELDPDVSSDGERIIFSRFESIGSNPQLWTIDSRDGSDLTKVTTQDANRYAVFRP
jgi:TolB protein